MSESYGRILSVENEADFRKNISLQLEDSGFTMIEAKNAEEAIALFREKSPDLVLSSLQLPDMEGLQLLAKIRKESPDTPFVVMSTAQSLNDLVESMRLGAWDYIAKPIKDMKVVEHVICRALERGRLVVENKKYRVELEKKNHQLTDSLSTLKDDQNAGKKVQQQLLPEAIEKIGPYTFSHTIFPSLYLSGDFIDYFSVNKDKVVFYIADVSGHGASSAFVTVLLKALVDQFLVNYRVHHDEMILQPDKVLKHISDNILYSNLGKFLTMIYCVLDVKKNVLHYSVGGHYPNPILLDNNTPLFLPGSGIAMGVFKKAKYTTHQYQLPTKFSFMMYSDGIFEQLKGNSLEEKEAALLNLFKNSNGNGEKMIASLELAQADHLADDVALFSLEKGIYE